MSVQDLPLSTIVKNIIMYINNMGLIYFLGCINEFYDKFIDAPGHLKFVWMKFYGAKQTSINDEVMKRFTASLCKKEHPDKVYVVKVHRDTLIIREFDEDQTIDVPYNVEDAYIKTHEIFKGGEIIKQRLDVEEEFNLNLTLRRSDLSGVDVKWRTRSAEEMQHIASLLADTFSNQYRDKLGYIFETLSDDEVL